MNVTAKQVAAGQAVYTRRVLHVYDLVVLGLSNRLLWKCPTARLIEHYNRHVTANHLDIGVGTGYFLNVCRFPAVTPRIALLDLNPNTLEFASKRIARYKPEVYLHNAFLPIAGVRQRFDSVAANYLLHCLPGSMQSKAVIFDHVKQLMNPGAVLFGSTLLPRGVPLGSPAHRLMAFYNQKGIFSNRSDTLDELDRALRSRFSEVSIHLIGCAALFSARV